MAPEERRRNAYDAFSDVDKLVAKPVLGSDGAASWQEFHRSKKLKSSSSAPLAPMKAVDRAAGFACWQDERKQEDAVREQAGEKKLEESGYTNFRQKTEHSNKKEDTLLHRTRPKKVEYFFPASDFQGFKFDYVFTTRQGRTGYYWDGMDSVKQRLNGATDEPTTPRANSVEPDANEQVQASDAQQPSKTKKKKKPKLAGPVIIDDPNHPMEQLKAALERKHAADSQTLPLGWEVATDATSGKPYYYNLTTGQRVWELPGSNTLPQGWSTAKDPTSGKEYYYNATTKETQWERPV